MIPRDVTTRWNSTYDMLAFTLEYRHVVEKFVADRKNNLRELELSEDEWKIVAQLSEVLMVGGYAIHGCIMLSSISQVLKHATAFFSSSTPNLAHVIPIMDHINDRLTQNALEENLSPAICAALGLAKKTLNRYYSRTDDSEAYRIAMSKFVSIYRNY